MEFNGNIWAQSSWCRHASSGVGVEVPSVRVDERAEVDEDAVQCIGTASEGGDGVGGRRSHSIGGTHSLGANHKVVLGNVGLEVLVEQNSLVVLL